MHPETRNPKLKALLIIIPLLTMVLNSAIVIERNPFYSSWSDPTYDYLFNGLNLARGHLDGHADHPGTPLQIYSGITIKFFHLFSNEDDIIKDVILRPEWYLFKMSITNCILISLVMFIAAWLMLRFTKNIFYALVIQLTHLISLRAIYFSPNLMTEFILVLTGVLLAPIIVAYALSEDKKQQQRLIIAAAILYGIMVAVKITSLPIILLWLIMSKHWKQTVSFLGVFLLSFLLFTIPGWHYAPQFFGWMGDIATHTGQYGRGSEGFAEWDKYFASIIYAADDVWLFTVTFFIITGIIIFRIIKFFLKKKPVVFKNIKPLAGIGAAIAVQTFIVCKHYSPHYLIPSHLLVIPALIIILNELIKYRNPAFTGNALLLIITPLILSIYLLKKAERQYYFFADLKQPDKILLEQIKPYKYDLILLDCSGNAPFPQPSLMFGVNYSGDQTALYFTYLEKYYKDFYFVKRNPEKLHYWHHEYAPKDVLKDSMTLLYYAADDKFNIDSLKWEETGLHVDSVLFAQRLPITRESLFIVKIKK